MDRYQIIKKYLLTEKSSKAKDEENKYFFEVDRRANKIEIRQAVEGLLKAKVKEVRVMNVEGRSRRFGKSIGKTKPWKKAIVTLAPGHTIEVFKGV
ncbi:MAG: 50S ribosomal protein L23 [Smithellaceae bacterium]|nr:50S ribosomal protein L23 [Smithellaceae bacterium]